MEKSAHVLLKNQIQTQHLHKKMQTKYTTPISDTLTSLIKNMLKKQLKKLKIIQKLKNSMINKYIFHILLKKINSTALKMLNLDTKNSHNTHKLSLIHS